MRQYSVGTNKLPGVSQLYPLYKVYDLSGNLVLIDVERVKDSLLKNSNYGRAIDQCLKNIRQSKSRLMEETQLYLGVTQKGTLSAAIKIQSQSSEIKSSIGHVDEHVVELSKGVNALKESLDDVIKNAECKLRLVPIDSMRVADFLKGTMR